MKMKVVVKSMMMKGHRSVILRSFRVSEEDDSDGGGESGGGVKQSGW